MAKQKIIKLHTMVNGVTFNKNGEIVSCKSIAEMIKDALDNHPKYTFSERIDIPTKCINTRECILILEK